MRPVIGILYVFMVLVACDGGADGANPNADKPDSSAARAAETATPDRDRVISTRTIRAHMAYLADDHLEGREAGSRGEALAALYIATDFARLGLLPMGDDGGFIQRVPLRSAYLDPASVRTQILTDGVPTGFENGDGVLVGPNLMNTAIDVTAPAVFVGHGVHAPEFGLTDYAGVDVAGKIAVVLGGPPAFLPPAEAAHFGSTAVKQRMAADAGAIGLIRLWTPANEAQIAFDLLRTFIARPSMTWVGPDGNAGDTAPEIRLRMTVQGTGAEALFAGAPLSAEAAISAGRDGPVAGFPLATTVSSRLTTRLDDGLSSANVAGFIQGTDPDLKDEVIVVTAHYDHVGLCKPEGVDDRICNGALDNALGTAAMMDVARRLSESGTPPRRSVLFLAVGAEEKGLLGSDYFAHHPTLGDRRIVANINMDGGLPFYDFSDVIAFGAEQSTLGETLARAVAPMGLAVGPDPFPELGIFTRSDQYSFVRQGVPALFLYNGFSDLAGDNVGLTLWNETLARHYHQPTDDLSLPIDYAVAAKYAEVFYRVTREAADAHAAPQWNANSMFRPAPLP